MLRQTVIYSVVVSMALATAAGARVEGNHFAGIEFYGSSQLTRMEAEKMLGLKPGASENAITQAVDRLKKQLDARHIEANVEIVGAPPDNIFLSIDVLDSSTDVVPTRRLKFPHHVNVTTEKPFILLKQLNDRLELLSSQGRPWNDFVKDGAKYYSDEPCNQIVADLLRFCPDMRNEFLSIIANDPDPNRRKAAVDLLSWSGSFEATAPQLIEAIDDSDPSVRASIVRYFFPRLEYLPEDFPYDRFIDALSRELNRPSHQDRSKALYCLLALCGQHKDLIKTIKELDESRIKQLSEQSVLPTVKGPADKLLQVFSQVKDPLQWLLGPKPNG